MLRQSYREQAVHYQPNTDSQSTFPRRTGDRKNQIQKKRFELVRSGIVRFQLKIRNLKMYNNGQMVTLD